MKRTATLLAGLLLVTGTVFAAESALDFSGSTIKVKTVIGTENSSFNDDSNGDTDYNLHLNYKLDDKTTATLGYTTDDDNYSTGDTSLNVKVNRKEGKVEAQFSAELDPDTAANFREGLDSEDTYIKYNYSKDMAVSFFPYRMELKNGSVFDEGDDYTRAPGVVVNYKNGYVGLGIDTVKVSAVAAFKGTTLSELAAQSAYNNAQLAYDAGATSDVAAVSASTEAVVVVKVGYTLTAGPATVAVKYSGAFWDKDKLGTANTVGYAGQIGEVTNDINVHADVKVSDKLSITAEAGYVTLYDDMFYVNGNDAASYNAKKITDTQVKSKNVDSGYGVSVKATYALSNVLAPYAEFKYSTDGYLAYGDRHDELGTVTLATGDVDVDGTYAKLL